MNASAPTRFSDDDLARLEALLGDEAWRDAALPPDAMQGLFCALAMGPQPSTSARAVAIALGGDSSATDDERTPPSPELVDLATRFHDETVAALASGSMSPLLYEMRRGRLDYRTWCRGFLEGVEHSDAGWHAAADPDEVDELLFPIHVAADALGVEERRAYRPAEWRKLLLESEQGLPAAIARIRDYWAIVRSPPATLRREGLKVGRNDPCPCGSGRKHKHCHGR